MVCCLLRCWQILAFAVETAVCPDRPMREQMVTTERTVCDDDDFVQKDADDENDGGGGIGNDDDGSGSGNEIHGHIKRQWSTPEQSGLQNREEKHQAKEQEESVPKP